MNILLLTGFAALTLFQLFNSSNACRESSCCPGPPCHRESSCCQKPSCHPERRRCCKQPCDSDSKEEIVTTDSPSIRTTTPITPVTSISSEKDEVRVDVKSSNTINNNNLINLKIDVKSDVKNNIDNKGTYGGGGGGGHTVIIPPGPVTLPPPTLPPFPTSGPYITPRPYNPCCIIIVPCVTPNCNPYHYSCHGCRGSIGYRPINPCYHGGCQRRDVWARESCAVNQCLTREVDCSYCDEESYFTYEGYSRCHGCFYGY